MKFVSNEQKSEEKRPESARFTSRSHPSHQEEEETDKTKQAQIEQTYEKN